MYFASQHFHLCVYIVILNRLYTSIARSFANCSYVLSSKLFYDAHMSVNGIGYYCAMSFATCVSIIRLFNGIFYWNHQNGYLWLMVALFRCCWPPVCLFMTFFACHPIQWQCVCVVVCLCVWMWVGKINLKRTSSVSLRIIFDFDVVDFQQTSAITPFSTCFAMLLLLVFFLC